jgi:ATP-dependent 26S proteasome regulatory subunit
MGVGTLEEIIDDDHAIVSSSTGPEYYVSILSFVDKDLLEPGCSILLHHKVVIIYETLVSNYSISFSDLFYNRQCPLLAYSKTTRIQWSV